MLLYPIEFTVRSKFRFICGEGWSILQFIHSNQVRMVHCKLRFISSTGPIFNQLEQAVSTLIYYNRQNGAVCNKNYPLLVKFMWDRLSLNSSPDFRFKNKGKCGYIVVTKVQYISYSLTKRVLYVRTSYILRGQLLSKLSVFFRKFCKLNDMNS